MRIILTALAAAALAAPLAAQAPDSAAIKLKQRVDAIFGVPQKADEARRAGTPDSTIQAIMKIFGREQVPAEDVGAILTAERDAARTRGTMDAKDNKDNFGAFVQRQHAAGLRGRELSDAIHAEQVRRGMKKGGTEMESHDAMGKEMKPDAAMNKGRKPDEAEGKGKKPEQAQGKGKKPNDAARSSR